MGYALTRGDDLPDLDIHLHGVPTDANPLGVKGAGPAGAIAAPPAVMAATLGALRPLGVRHIEMPATPERFGGLSGRWGRVLRSQRFGFDDHASSYVDFSPNAQRCGPLPEGGC